MNNNLLTRWLRSEDLFLQSEVRAVDRSHLPAERAREFDARDHAGLRGFGGRRRVAVVIVGLTVGFGPLGLEDSPVEQH